MLSNSPTIAQLPVFDKSTLTRHEITQDGGIISFRYNKVLSGSNTTVSSSPGAAGGTSFDYDHSASYDIFWEILKYDSLGREQWRTDMEEQYKNSKYVLSKDGNCAFEIAEIVTYPLLGKPISELQVRRLDMNGYFSIPISVYPEENRWKEVLDFSTGSNINFFIQPENSPKIKEICDPIKTLWVRIDENLNITTDTIFFPTFNSKKIDNITFTFIGSREADAQFIVNYTNKDIC